VTLTPPPSSAMAKKE